MLVVLDLDSPRSHLKGGDEADHDEARVGVVGVLNQLGGRDALVTDQLLAQRADETSPGPGGSPCRSRPRSAPRSWRPWDRYTTDHGELAGFYSRFACDSGGRSALLADIIRFYHADSNVPSAPRRR